MTDVTATDPFLGILPRPSAWLAKTLPPFMPSSMAKEVLGIPRTFVTQVRKGSGFTRTNVHDENLVLRAKNKALEAEILVAKKALYQTKRYLKVLKFIMTSNFTST